MISVVGRTLYDYFESWVVLFSICYDEFSGVGWSIGLLWVQYWAKIQHGLILTIYMEAWFWSFRLCDSSFGRSLLTSSRRVHGQCEG